jgi:IS5 family transposase
VDTTVVEANVHHPTDSGLIADTVRVVTRLVKQAQAAVGEAGTAVRDRTRSIKKRVLAIAKVLKRRTQEAVEEVRRITGEMADIAEKTLKAARGVVEHLRREAQNLAGTVKARRQRLAVQLEKALALGEQVIKQARQVNAGQLILPNRLVSIFEPEAMPIKRGKAHRETEFGYKVRLTESAERLVTEYEVMMGNPSDKELLVPGVEKHIHRTGRVPQSVATDRGFWAPAGDSHFKENGCAKSQPSF